MSRNDDLRDIISRKMIVPCADGVSKPSQYVDALILELNRYIVSSDMDAYSEGRKDGVNSGKDDKFFKFVNEKYPKIASEYYQKERYKIA